MYIFFRLQYQVSCYTWLASFTQLNSRSPLVEASHDTSGPNTKFKQRSVNT